MDEITLRDYRCFHSTQTARLAPLTLIVGENSTGKTSFMAMIRALWEIAYTHSIPNFKEEPYDLGSFAEIAHHRGGRGGRAESFEAGFHIGEREVGPGQDFSFKVLFKESGAAPFPVVRRAWNSQASVTAEQSNGATTYAASTGDKQWRTETGARLGGSDDAKLLPMGWIPALLEVYGKPLGKMKDAELETLQDLVDFSDTHNAVEPFASAPVRSKPRRTYDPARPSRNPEGDYVPMYLAQTYRRQDKRGWNALKARLEAFGAAAGLFDELAIKTLGAQEGAPFHLQVRKRGKRAKGPWRNLIDVGYGVSQILPLITELLRADAPSIFLLQQPEVHLHPSAQAALGTLFCEAAKDRQLIVETHSDHLVNRIRMDVRDRTGSLSPEQVSILYFERNELEVRIHSLRIDESGNVLDAPPGYGRFFMEETARSLKY